MRMLLYSIMQKHVTHDVMSIFYHLGIFCVYPASSCWQDCWLGPRFHVFPQETWSPNILAKLPLQENFLWISSIQVGDQRALLSIFAVTLHCTVSHPITNLRIEGWRSWMKCNISFISKKANLFDFLMMQLQSFNKIIARYFCLPCARQLPRKHIRCISPLIHCLVKCFQKFGRRDLWNAEKHFYVHPPSPS